MPTLRGERLGRQRPRRSRLNHPKRLAVRSWLGRQRVPEKKPDRKDSTVVRLIGLLPDPLPGIRDLAREALVARDFVVKESASGALSLEE